MEESVALIYVSSKLSEIEIKTIITLQQLQNKEMRDFLMKNFKTLMKLTEENTVKQRKVSFAYGLEDLWI